jgi:hypothetical protein
MKDRFYTGVLVGFLFGMLGVAAAIAGYRVGAAPPVRPRPLEPKGEKPPEDGRLHVWPMPQQGTQTLLVLRVLDADTVEAAYLVPQVFHLKGTEAPRSEREALRAAGELNKLVGGKLLPCNLSGKDGWGRTECDFWLGKGRGWAGRVLLRRGLVKKASAPKEGD